MSQHEHSLAAPPGVLSTWEKSAWKAIGCAHWQLLGSQELDYRVVPENPAPGFDATPAIFAELGA
jgi:hypothetical protein